MSKFMLFVCIVLLATTVITAAPNSCGRHGDPVSKKIILLFLRLRSRHVQYQGRK